MKIFVPRFRTDLPDPNPAILNVMFTEIHEKDLPNVIAEWKRQRTMTDCQSIKLQFRRSVRHICTEPTRKNTLWPHLLRPHFTIHSGASQGNRFVQEIGAKAMEEMGRLAKKNGFTLFYGGGDSGNMGKTLDGFLSGGESFPRQYSVQISPADFAAPGGVESKNGMHPINEGLSKRSDVAIVMPHFVTRRHMLDGIMGKKDAAATCPGAEGSVDECFDIAVLRKTGLIETNLYVLNLPVPLVVMDTPIPFINIGYWRDMRRMMKKFLTYGYGKQKSYDSTHFLSSPQKIFDHLMFKLDAEGNNPHQVYERRVKEYELACQCDSVRPKSCSPLPVKITSARHGD
jgi:predicted Rossmann-fold nucleotide-binding protein